LPIHFSPYSIPCSLRNGAVITLAGPIIDPFNLLQGVQEFCASILYLVVLCQFLISDAQRVSFEKPRAHSRSQHGHFLLLCLSLSFSKIQMESSPLVVGENKIRLGPKLTAYPLLELWCQWQEAPVLSRKWQGCFKRLCIMSSAQGPKEGC
jgi:hypothetical protein